MNYTNNIRERFHTPKILTLLTIFTLQCEVQLTIYSYANVNVILHYHQVQLLCVNLHTYIHINLYSAKIVKQT